ncbi:hypothetical protein I8748_10510 [Nostoc sp. CENA67]|uniref:Uncharacterized protein n=1 Tax=Amazonocrinis nigriterrae CENA67 TaxID=2794033 RepID=A0A8J7HRB0_9NOST|nr:DUF6658 family protein [Amazonocrinis nigriterrae]MBH8562605.1 hypothetical protein [Amazonocrinis nigriterrae CENA67]
MKGLKSLWKRLPVRQILTVFLAGIFLIVSTACSGANAQGANPQNPAVQAGGANNPYKGGGDKYTKYRESASLQPNLQVLIATNNQSEILYPGAETPAGRVEKQRELPLITEENFQKPEPGNLIQNEPELGTRVKERLETVKEAVQDASGFLKEKGNEASSRPELQKNPAVGR